MEQENSGVDKVILEPSEFEAVQLFIKFLKGRIRGEFKAEIVATKDQRYVTVSITNTDRIRLKVIDSTSQK